MTPVTVYSKPACVQCDATKRRLTKLDVPYTVVDITEDHAALARVTSWGYQQAPVVHVKTPTGEHHFSGYRPDLLNGLVAEKEKTA